MTRLVAIFLCALAATVAPGQTEVTVGSKTFTESIVLGEVLAAVAENDTDANVSRKLNLGGTQLVYKALVAGEIDAYVEYTGTLLLDTFASDNLANETQLTERLSQDGLVMLAPLGFANNYGLAVRRNTANALSLRTIDDLRSHPDLVFSMNSEFLERGDGWLALREAYQLPPFDVLDATHEIAYRALAGGESDVMVVYTTDAKIGELDLVVLDDNRSHFPRYDAVIVHQQDLNQSAPGVVAAWQSLAGSIDEATMIELNRRVDGDGRDPGEVAAAFTSNLLGTDIIFVSESTAARVLRYTLEHLLLVVVPTAAALLIAIPVGVLAARRPSFAQPVLGFVGIVQTVPSLALLVLLVPILAWAKPVLALDAIGPAPAIITLTLYSLLPIVRNTHAGLSNIAPSTRESAEALGLSTRTRLTRIDLPLALPTIFAGIKTAAVINVGYATLGAFVGAGGYGTPILTWTRTDDPRLLLEGALPAMVMALCVQGLFEFVERAVTPRGLRAK
ncbi:MAG: glycine betaine ABC transporter substrate-binding protein [Planctomycetota bacterium]